MIMVDELKKRIYEKGFNINEISHSLGINTSTFYRKMKSGGDSFSIGEAKKISELLNLTYRDINTIFFGRNVA